LCMPFDDYISVHVEKIFFYFLFTEYI
jgi:hypothetical protein